MIYAGSNPERQAVGYPGHCARCCEVGHVKAHPDRGCGDVGCYAYHDEDPAPEDLYFARSDLHLFAGVTRQRIQQLTGEGKLPEPDALVGFDRRPLWRRSTIMAWVDRREESKAQATQPRRLVDVLTDEEG